MIHIHKWRWGGLIDCEPRVHDAIQSRPISINLARWKRLCDAAARANDRVYATCGEIARMRDTKQVGGDSGSCRVDDDYEREMDRLLNDLQLQGEDARTLAMLVRDLRDKVES